MKILLLRGVGIRGVGYPAGVVLEVEDGDAKTLIALKKAEPAPESKAPEAIRDKPKGRGKRTQVPEAPAPSGEPEEQPPSSGLFRDQDLFTE